MGWKPQVRERASGVGTDTEEAGEGGRWERVWGSRHGKGRRAYGHHGQNMPDHHIELEDQARLEGSPMSECGAEEMV